MAQAEVETLARNAKKSSCFGLAASGLEQGCLEQATLEAGHRALIALRIHRLFVLLSAGCFHTCGITSSGETFCWGRNAEGQLGTGDNVESTTPVRVFRSP